MSILVEHNGVNINDYIVACDNVPSFYLNLDSTIGLADYSMEVSNTYSGTLVQGNIINVTINGKVVHNGFIQYAENLYESRTTRLTILPTLAYLQDYNIDPDSLDLTSVDAENYCADPNYPSLYSVKLLWFLDRMFNKAGLIVNTSAVASASVGTAYEYYSPYTAIPFTGDDVALDYNAIYCLNQNFATIPSGVKVKYVDDGSGAVVATDYDAIKNQPSYFDVISQIMSFFGWAIVLDGTYKMIPLTGRTALSVSDGVIYQYSRNEEQPASTACKYSTNYARRGYYALDTKTDVAFLDSSIYSPESSVGDNLKTIQWMNNLWFMLRDRREGATAGALRTLGGTDTTPLTFSPVILHADVDYVRGDKFTKAKIVTETETDFNTSVLDVYEHYHDLASRHTILKEISFL